MRKFSCELCSPHDRLSSAVGLVELLVPVGQEGVALTNCFTNQCCVFWTKQPGLTTGCVQVGMSPEEWLVRPRLVPTHQQLSARGLEETTNISYEMEEVNVSHVWAVQSSAFHM